jgi:plasmid stability protein
MKDRQYTLRGIPERTDRVLRERAATYGESLNEAALKALERGLNLSDAPLVHHDLDELAGTWVKDPAFDKAISTFERVEPELWK